MKPKSICLIGLMAFLGGLLSGSGVTRAEVKEVRIAIQYGIAYLPALIARESGLIEKHAKSAGLGDIQVKWSQFSGANVMNDALLAGSLDFAFGGAPALIVMWDRTRGNLNVRGVCSVASLPLVMTTRNPNVKSIRDFTDKDKIALPAVKVSIQAVVLQMAAARIFGDANYGRLDPLTISLSHPDGVAALLSDSSEITAHFTAPPFHYRALKKPGVRVLLTSNDILGGPASNNLVYTTTKFHAENPKVYQAFVAAMQEAVAIINKNRRAAAQMYLRLAKSKEPPEDVHKLMEDPITIFTTTPQNMMKFADFMYQRGTIRAKPASWKDLFFENIHGTPGS